MTDVVNDLGSTGADPCTAGVDFICAPEEIESWGRTVALYRANLSTIAPRVLAADKPGALDLGTTIMGWLEKTRGPTAAATGFLDEPFRLMGEFGLVLNESVVRQLVTMARDGKALQEQAIEWFEAEQMTAPVLPSSGAIQQQDAGAPWPWWAWLLIGTASAATVSGVVWGVARYRRDRAELAA